MQDRIHRDEVHTKEVCPEGKAVAESLRRIPVAADVDVLVVGGGPAGVGAAIAATREGAKTLLIERFGMLGGMWTAGLVNPLFDFRRKGWIVAELIDRLETAGAWITWRHAATFDVEVMKRTLEEMMAEAGAEFWYYSLVADAVVESHTGGHHREQGGAGGGAGQGGRGCIRGWRRRGSRRGAVRDGTGKRWGGAAGYADVRDRRPG
ncbi:MAG: FAD-dependent oxidoreductase [Planctomycetes bacterium]|nr:FAD-dependent oxidoreductase [Planctomycetota bacterium]